MRLPIKIAIPATAVGAMVVGGWALLPAATSGASAPKVATTIVAPMAPVAPAQTPTPEPTSTASESPEPTTPEPAGDTYADPPGQDVNHECPPACGPGETP
ncbi:MAG: hypothetical protein QOD49_1732 [Actinomycetota bacterium]|jgi:hypothetical protein|nr:hypothetical protein [Actinomycetota bacterium]